MAIVLKSFLHLILTLMGNFIFLNFTDHSLDTYKDTTSHEIFSMAERRLR